MMSKLFKSVSADEFDRFLKAYPRPLERDVYGAAEPPLVTYNDFQRAPYWPDSVVASTNTERTFFSVLSDISAPAPDDGKRDTDSAPRDQHGTRVKEGDKIRVHWGCRVNLMTGEKKEDWREHTAVIRDKGTKYEAWSPSGTANLLRSMTFEIVA